MHLKKPDYGDFTNSGLVVLDNGPYAGQRIEIDAEQCYLYGYNLGRTDLSYLFMTSKKCFKELLLFTTLSVMGRIGLEPMTRELRARCSTN